MRATASKILTDAHVDLRLKNSAPTSARTSASTCITDAHVGVSSNFDEQTSMVFFEVYIASPKR
jgi:hypothetical protein